MKQLINYESIQVIIRILLLTLNFIFLGYSIDILLYYFSGLKVEIAVLSICLFLFGFVLFVQKLRGYNRKEIFIAITIALLTGVLIKNFTNGDPIFDFFKNLLKNKSLAIILIVSSTLIIHFIKPLNNESNEILDDDFLKKTRTKYL